jgi:hypothetical protein
MAREGYEPTYRPPWPTVEELLLASDATPGEDRVASRDCGTGAGGFKPGNKCGGGGGAAGEASPKVKAWAEKKFADPEHAKAFAEWFGDSKVVDDGGNPVVMYHGTKADFDEFDLTKATEAALHGPGVYMTDSPGTASEYGKEGKVKPLYASIRSPLDLDAKPTAKEVDAVKSALMSYKHERKEGERLKKWQANVNASIDNALQKVDSSKSNEEMLKSIHGTNLGIWERETSSGKAMVYKAFSTELNAELLSRAGFDGLRHRGGRIMGDGKEHTVYIAFRPTQVKSATGNSGSFDPKNPKITRSSRAWCKGASPPDNSCPPSNKGKGGKGSGGGGAKGKSKGDKGGKGSKGRKSSKGFDPDKSSAAIMKKLTSVDTRLSKKIDSALKREEKTKAATSKAFDKIRSFDTAWVAARDALDKDPGNASKKRALDRINKQMQAAAEAHAKNKDAYQSARQQRELAVEERAKAGREVLRQELSREIQEIAGTDGLANIYESSKATIQKTHSDRLKKVRDPEARGRVADAYAFMLEHTNPAIHAGALQPKLSMRGNVRAYARRGGFDRETFEPTVAPEVVVSSRESPSVIAHEIGHCVEYNPEATRLAQEFRTRRTAGSQEVSFRSKFGRGYKSDERGAPDDFKKAHLAAGYDEKESEHRAHYTGKRYASGSTEVISMGVELLKKDPAAFAKSDPEWFTFTTGIMTGRLLTESRQKKKARA